ncbi:MAG: 50S ribosomal protein L18e [Thermoproteota archaeon]|nr:MAG: 50S ribosomal protein L18e [Candidatus Korarchaeota archaeon]RLG53057.1 MAG: 50S ribosomal protein L18e [Candidatus Korarchaeota archaeon]
MPKPTGPTNPSVIRLINLLEKSARVNGAKIWKRVADIIRKPRRKRVAVNVWKIGKYAQEASAVVVPGVVLGYGRLDKPVTVAALKVSPKAKEKIIEAGGKVISIEDLIKENPRGSGVRIIV